MSYKDLNNLNEDQIKEWVNGFHAFYKYQGSFSTRSKKQYILGKKDKRICRYCGKDKTQTSFRSNAHIIPKVIGNQFVSSYYECDDCNTIFGKYETDLSSFIGLRGYFEPVENYYKKRHRVYKSPSGVGIIYSSKRGTEINDLKGEIFEEFENGKLFKSKVNKKPYVPLNVYKSLIKMSLSVLKDETMGDFKLTTKFLISDELDINPITKIFARLSQIRLVTFYTEFPGIFAYKKWPNITDFETTNNIRVPDKTFIIFFRDSCYQIFIPFDASDDWDPNIDKRDTLFPQYPPMIAERKNYSKFKIFRNYYYESKDLYCTEKVKNDKDEFCFECLVEPILLEYKEEEHEKLIKEYNLRR